MENTLVIDLGEALKRAMGDVDFLKMMLNEFHNTIPDFIHRLENAYRVCDMPSIGKDAHQLKGAAANLGVKTLAGAALKLEQIGKSADPDGCGQALEELKQAADIFNRHFARIYWAEVRSD